MCNYMGYRVSKVEMITLKNIEKEFGQAAALDLVRNGFSYGDWPIIVANKERTDFEIRQAHWEFIPWWIRNEDELKAARKQGIPWLNARSETLLTSKMFREAALKRRCLVLATHFFEWRHYKPEGQKKDVKYPYKIELLDQDYFFMAGIFQPWTDKSTGEMKDTFAIITTESNELMSVIHNNKKRQPTILTEDLAWEWVMEDISEERIKEIARYKIPSEFMGAHPITKDFMETGNVCEFDYEDLPDLDLAQ